MQAGGAGARQLLHAGCCIQALPPCLPMQGLKSSGGFVWACKNYDGDVQSDIVAQVR